jgi:RNA polymerase sigma factor (TIGR02999 family)
MDDDSNALNRADDDLLPLVYDELRKLAARRLAEERPGQTLDATALVHEAYLRLLGPSGNGATERWAHRGHFFAAAAEAMRRILIDRARGKATARRGGDWKRIDFERFDPINSVTPDQLALLDETLDRLLAIDKTGGELVKLRCYAGLSLQQAAEALEISLATAYRHWAFARAWLHGELTAENGSNVDFS